MHASSDPIGSLDARAVIGRRELYRRMSRIGDLIHAVADRVWYAVVKEA